MKGAGGLNDKQKHDRRLSRLSVISLIAAALLIFVLFFGAMLHFGLVQLPSFVTALFKNEVSGESPGLPENIERLYEALEGGGSDVTVVSSITPEDAASYLEATDPITVYTATLRTVIRDGDEQLVRRIELWRDGSRWRAEITASDGSAVKTLICDSSRVSITSFETGEQSTLIYSAGAVFSMEDSVGMPDVSSLRDLLFGGGDGAENVSFSIARASSESLYLAEYDLTGSPVQHEKTYISLEYGLIVRVEATVDGNTVYQMTVEKLEPSVSAGNADLFIIPAS